MRQIGGRGDALVTLPQCDLTSQQYVCQLASLNAHRNRIADLVCWDFETGRGSRPNTYDESQSDI